MKIVLITYPTSPFRGSEFSVSWNYIINMSKFHELYVLYGTSGNGFGNVSELKNWLKYNKLNNVHFIDIHVPNNLISSIFAFCRKVNYTYGSYIQYKYYYKQVYKKTQEIIKKENIDVIHYLNPIGFKEPGKCWKISNIPYIWGPIKAVENIPFALYKALSFKGKINALIKLILHNIVFLTFPNIRKAFKRADFIFAAVPKTVVLLKKVYNINSIYLPENGINKMERDNPIQYIPQKERLNIIWIGRLDEFKALIILIDALKKVNNKKWHLHVVGDGYLKDKLKNSSKSISSNITWHGTIPRIEVLRLLSSMHLHVITSLSEATSTVLLEAMSYAVPTITLDHCGMAGVVCEKCGIKIPIKSYKQVVNDIAIKIDYIIENPNYINILSRGVIECSKKYMWEKRIEIFNDIYNKAVLKYKNNNENTVSK